MEYFQKIKTKPKKKRGLLYCDFSEKSKSTAFIHSFVHHVHQSDRTVFVACLRHWLSGDFSLERRPVMSRHVLTCQRNVEMYYNPWQEHILHYCVFSIFSSKFY